MVILNMNMPKSCLECDLRTTDSYDDYFCVVNGTWGERERAENCPIIADLPRDRPWALFYDEQKNELHYHNIVKDGSKEQKI